MNNCLKIKNSIIISYKESNEERKNNLQKLLIYLLSFLNYETEIIIVEQDFIKRSNWINQYTHNNQIKHIFISNLSIFNKGKGYNIGVKTAKGENLIFNDIDVFLNSETYQSSLKHLYEFDVVNPYDKICFLTKEESDEFILNKYDFDIIKSLNNKITPGVTSGGIFMMKKEKYDLIGGFDEDCYGYGYEDDIFDIKMEKFELNLKKIEDTAIHIYHSIKKSIYDKYYTRKNENKELFEKYKKMTIDEIKEKIKPTIL